MQWKLLCLDDFTTNEQTVIYDNPINKEHRSKALNKQCRTSTGERTKTKRPKRYWKREPKIEENTNKAIIITRDLATSGRQWHTREGTAKKRKGIITNIKIYKQKISTCPNAVGRVTKKNHQRAARMNAWSSKPVVTGAEITGKKAEKKYQYFKIAKTYDLNEKRNTRHRYCEKEEMLKRQKGVESNEAKRVAWSRFK